MPYNSPCLQANRMLEKFMKVGSNRVICKFIRVYENYYCSLNNAYSERLSLKALSEQGQVME